MATYLEKDMRARYEAWTRLVVVHGRFLSPCIGGQPAGDDGLAAFVAYYLKLSPGTPEFGAAVERIKKQEIGEKKTTPEGGEIDTAASYGVNVLRRCEHCKGPVLGAWQIKAALKCAASRLGLFVKKKGAKGDVAEAGEILDGEPCVAKAGPTWEARRFVHLWNHEKQATPTFTRLQGKVQTPQGSKSIQHDSETVPVGTTFTFEIRLPRTTLTDKDVLDMIAVAGEVGLGSVRSLEYGNWIAEKVEVGD